ncbi:helix-turn-helix transcriptional regulator [Microbacterium imperiale]|uniref:helix-turn-helix transcriptional regulator n=1 Tax=Microbacterium imperiale TaxID=33884 RepID=UPI001FDAA7E3|nr:helix-turn-helix domain-containing protein [Microbacterium imperiale]
MRRCPLSATATTSVRSLADAVASSELLDALIRPDTLADRLGTTERNLSEWRITGRGPRYIRIGRSVRYRPEAVDAWLLAQEHASTAEEAC